MSTDLHAALRRAERRLAALEGSGLVGMVVTDAEGRVRDANDAFLAMLGYTRDDLTRELTLQTIVPSEWQHANDAARASLSRDGRASPSEKEYVRKDGSRVRMIVSLAALDDGTFVWTTTDVTELRRAEAALRETAARHDQIVQSVRMGISVFGRDFRIATYNPFLEEITRTPASAILGKTLPEVRPDLAGSETERAVQRAMKGESVHMPDRLFGADIGHPLWLSIDYVPLRSTAGEITGVLVTSRDVTAYHEAVQAAKESEGRFRQLAESLRGVFWMSDLAKTRMIYVSPAYERIWGRSCESLVGAPWSWLDAVHPDDRAAVEAAVREKQAQGTYDEQYRVARPDGSVVWVRDRAFPVLDDAGAVVGLAGIAEDVTEQRELEAQVRQAQRMESIAQLAGGVAHDFNNLLTVVASNCELLIEQLPPEGEPSALAREVRAAGVRASALTQQLLAFSRRQFVEPKVFDPNQAISEISRLLGRLLGKDVTLITALDRSVPPVRVDPGHLSQALINLAVHARDSMPRGGRLTLATRSEVVAEEPIPLGTPTGRTRPPSADVLPGRYVVISITDDGEPLSEEMRMRMFEPFFTTKVVGRGTGLGLSAVHGMIAQSGGTITVRNAKGGGTIFDVYLPVAPERPAIEEPKPIAPSRAGRGTILLVEDDTAVRRTARRILEADGYIVAVARDGRHALEVHRELGGPVDLLLTDVVMPEMGGVELAEELAKQQPGLRILFTSGYSDDAVIRRIIESTSAFLQKPYTRESLIAKVRASIEGRLG